MDTMTPGAFVIFCISQIAITFAHDHFSKYQFETFPKTLYKCNNMSVTFGEVSHEQEKQHIVSYLDCFKGDTIKTYKPNITQERINQFNEVIRMMSGGHWRLRRQAIGGSMRSEVRSLTPGQWRQVTGRFNRIFNNGILRQIVSFHSDDAVSGAHDGPAFLGWHRILLLWIEFYLGVPVPYWDSSLDFHITDPTESILWTRFYFGNGRGTVRTGPFRTFTEPDGSRINRNIGRSGTLIARENIEAILNRTSNRDLVYTDMITLEGYHIGPHVWTGGTLSGIITAPSDPCFWFHHSFVDKVWRDAQLRMRNPEEYPYESSSPASQRPRQPMVMFPFDRNLPLLNRDGYMNWIARRATYQRSPGQATSRFQCENRSWRRRLVLEWDESRQICVSGRGNTADFETPPEPQTNRLSSSGFNDGSIPRLVFESPLQDVRTRFNEFQSSSRSQDDARALRNDVFNNVFVSEIHDVRTGALEPQITSSSSNVDRRGNNAILDELLLRLERRQSNLFTQLVSNMRPSGINSNSINSIGSSLQLPTIGGNVLGQIPVNDISHLGLPTGNIGTMIGHQTGNLESLAGPSISSTGNLIGQPIGQTGQLAGHTFGHGSTQNAETSANNNRLHGLMTQALQAARQRNAPTIGSIDMTSFQQHQP
ncbi:uncharacterized protein [Argopecten irradians]|uniref:uncharacterized protein n=1 Tax=Argopecten irradians TaxID=31199 RepID=UPI00371E9016